MNTILDLIITIGLFLILAWVTSLIWNAITESINEYNKERSNND